MPQDIQLVFQGGGAKLSALLAAASAVQEMQADGRVNVTRVCGTSAGAIAASILATGLPISDFRNRLRDRGERYLKYINADVSRLQVAIAIARGQPFLSEPGFRRILWDLFDHDTGRIESFDQLKIPLTVVAADIRNGRRVVYSKGSGGVSLIDALVDSAALPLVFRGGAGGQHIVDGGLCENLPVVEMDDEPAGGEAIVSATPAGQIPIDVMQRLSRVYDVQHHPVPVQLHSMSLQVTAFCLLDRNDPRSSRPDKVREVLYLTPLAEPLFCYRLALSSHGTGAVDGLTGWRVTNRLNNEVEIISIPIIVPEA